jgi:antitoxin component HigA of HigAB toxin-antitoxin module
MADRYLELLIEFKPRPIHSEKALARAYRLIEKLMRKDALSADEADMLEMLSVLVEQFESRENATPVLSSSELLEHLIEAHGISQSDVARQTQIPRSTNLGDYYYRLLAVEWSEWDDFGLFATVNEIVSQLHDDESSDFAAKREGILQICLKVLRDLEHEGLFGPRTDQRFLAICLSDSDDEIMMESLPWFYTSPLTDDRHIAFKCAPDCQKYFEPAGVA